MEEISGDVIAAMIHRFTFAFATGKVPVDTQINLMEGWYPRRSLDPSPWKG